MHRIPTVGFVSMGCPKALVDSEIIMTRLRAEGYRLVGSYDNADLVIVNTCGFLNEAVAESVEAISEALAENGRVIVTGCLGSRKTLAGENYVLAHCPKVLGVTGPGEFDLVYELVHKYLPQPHDPRFDLVPPAGLKLTPKHYAYLKIAEGCDNRCSYCIIPYLRGKFRSRQMDDVLYEARLLAASGVKEIIVVAQDTSRYGTDLPGHKRLLPELLRQLCAIEDFHWVRLHYLYPDEIDDELIDTIASEPKIVKYLDIPIQHCNSKILHLMNRRGDGAYLRELFAKLRDRIPGLVLRTSVITGLPGEGEEEFAELCAFLREMKLERVGAFPFSPEEGTPAAQMEFVDNEIAQSRAQFVETIQSAIMDEYNAAIIGKSLDVLVDGYDQEYEQYFGRTYADSPEIDGRVWIATQEDISEGEFVKVCIDGLIDGDLTGYIVEEEV